MIEEELAEQTTPHEVNFLKERIASLSGGVGVIYVGAGTDIERKEKKDRVDDAVCATAAALEAGILPGGGIALMDVAASTSWGSNESERVAWHILQSAMLAPFRQILTNGGIPYENIEREIRSSDPGTGYDVSAMTIGNMVKMGIVDPAKVTINALENAVSVATTIMSTNCIITNVRQS
jgi:chaperonin GroEL